VANAVRQCDEGAHGVSTIDDVSLLAGPGVRSYLDRLEELLATTVAWRQDGPVADAAGGTLRAGGKRLRPLLCYLSAAVRDGDDLVRAGAAVELVHSATLVHDDVLDEAPLRRGRPTVWATGGPDLAVATGDYLFARAFALLVETGDAAAVAELAECALGLARGEALQMLQARDPRTTPDQYLERCGLKTGLLFATACALGARLGGVPAEALPAVRRYGHDLGLAFQIADDVLDCAGSMESTGKPIGTDLLDGTASLPLIYAARTDDGVAHAIAERPAPDEVLGLLARVAECGAVAEARAVAHDCARQAEAALDDLDEHLDTRPLRAVVRGVVDREA
jgi:geranylgeranyl pyrophosphate synthase